MHNLTTDSSYQELALYLENKAAELKSYEKVVKSIKADIEDVKVNILPQKMEAEGMQTVTVKGVGRLSNNPQFRASVKAEHKQEMQQWLRDRGFEAMIQETLNSSTLKAWVKEQLEQGAEVPTDYLNLHSFDMVTLTKK